MKRSNKRKAGPAPRMDSTPLKGLPVANQDGTVTIVEPVDLFGWPSSPPPQKRRAVIMTGPDEHGSVYVYLPNHPRTKGCVARTVRSNALDWGPQCTSIDVSLDYNAAGELIGIELLNVKEKV